MPPGFRDFRLIVFLSLSVFVTGCGGDKLVKVSGRATRRGKPLPNFAINFTPEKGLRSFALTDPDGRFDMVYTDGREGVLVGRHKVWIQLPTIGAKEDKDLQKRLDKQKNDPEIAQLLKKYGNATTTPMTVDANEDREIDLPFD